MASIFVVIAEAGDANDYTTHNICAYENSSMAEKVAEVLNAIAAAKRTFTREDLRDFDRRYMVLHPTPCAPKYEEFGELYPELPAEFAALTIEECKGPEYEKYLQTVVEYNTRLEAFRVTLSKIESDTQKAFQEWESAYNAAIEEFKFKFDVASLIPKELKTQIELCSSCMEIKGVNSFLVEEIDLLS